MDKCQVTGRSTLHTSHTPTHGASQAGAPCCSACEPPRAHPPQGPGRCPPLRGEGGCCQRGHSGDPGRARLAASQGDWTSRRPCSRGHNAPSPTTLRVVTLGGRQEGRRPAGGSARGGDAHALGARPVRRSHTPGRAVKRRHTTGLARSVNKGPGSPGTPKVMRSRHARRAACRGITRARDTRPPWTAW